MINDFVANEQCWIVAASALHAELLEVPAGSHFTSSQSLVERFETRELAIERILFIRPTWKDPSQIEVVESKPGMPLPILPAMPDFNLLPDFNLPPVIGVP